MNDKSPTSKVNDCGRGNGQPGGQLDVGASLSDAELRQHIQDCGRHMLAHYERFETLGDPAFARAAIGGKKTAEIKARTSDEIKFALQHRCHQLNMTESEYIDRLVAMSLFGVEHVISVEQQRTKAVAGLWPVGGAS